MKTFILGLPESGRTTTAKALAQDPNIHYVSASNWLLSSFRPLRRNEELEQYDKEFQQFYVNRLKLDPYCCIDNLFDSFGAVGHDKEFVIDGITNPKDLSHLLNYNEDVVVFLNRTDPQPNPKDYEGVAINVMRDYCLYLATIGLLPKNRWLEYNFKIPGEESDFVKQLGKHNSVTITKSISKAIEHLTGELCKFRLKKEE